MSLKKLEFGKYHISLSIGYYGADQEDTLDISENYTCEEWEALTPDDQAAHIYEMSVESLGQNIDYSYKFVGKK